MYNVLNQQMKVPGISKVSIQVLLSLKPKDLG